MEERRKAVRRQADRDLLAQAQRLRQDNGGDANKQIRHMRRHAIRHHCSVELALRTSYASGFGDTWTPGQHRLQGRILDLSADGCQVFTRDELAIGGELSLIIQIDGGTKVPAVGVVRWTKSIPERGGYASGLQFGRLKEPEAGIIRNFLAHLDRTIGL